MRLTILLLFLQLVAANGKATFLLLVPETVSPSSSLVVNANAMEEDLEVELKLQTSTWINTPYWHSSHSFTTRLKVSDHVDAGETREVKLKVPKDLQEDEYTLYVRVVVNGTEHINMYKLKFEARTISIFIQTDKAIYKPGTTVNFRTFAIYPDLLTYKGNTTVEIFDPSNNKLKQMLHVSDPTGVITNSLKLSAMPIFGHWKIKVTIEQGQVYEKTFEVANYKLPRFEVKVKLPPFVLLTDHNIEGKVTATYTFGEPVTGVVEIHAKVPSENTGTLNTCGCEQPSVIMSFPLDGEGTFSIPVEEIQHMRIDLKGQKLTVEAYVTETLTGKKLNGSSTTTFYDNAVMLKYLDYNSAFKPGLTFTGTLMASLQDNHPLPNPRKNVSIDVCVKTHLGLSLIDTCDVNQSKTLPVPLSGLVHVKLDVPSDAKKVVVNAYYGNAKTQWTIEKAFSPSDSFIQVELQEAEVNVGDEIDVAISATEPLDELWYQVISNGELVDGQRIDGGMKTSLNFKINATNDMAPHARVIVYYIRDDGEIVPDSKSIDVKGLFDNKVSVGFSANQSQPHEKIDVIVKADPQSLVSLLVVDQSVTLLASGNDITPETVESELKYSYKLDNKPVDAQTGADQVFKDVNIRVFTNGVLPTDIFKAPPPTTSPHPYPGPSRYPIGYIPSPGATPYIGPTPYPLGYTPMPGATPYPGPSLYPIGFTPYPGATPYAGPTPKQGVLPIKSGPSLKQVERVRTLFPETWLWTNTTIGDNGTSTLNAVVPDTVTSWLATAFAVNPITGLGVTSTKGKLRVFRPFFVSLDVPMSVIRGEQVVVTANVFNYLQDDLDVMVTMTKSDDYINLLYDSKTSSIFHHTSADQFKSVTVPSNGASTVYFPIVPNKLGQLDIKVSARSTKAADAVTRKLTVQAEGIRKETNVPVTIDLLNSNVYNKTVPISLPNYIVKDSQRVRVRAFGDVITPSLKGLDSLLQMPTGCGEQNMMGLAPDVYVTNYLMQSNKFTGEIEARVMPFMEEGYHRELKYQHDDASFSAWGNSDSSGSTWLTAFVAKTFVQARNYVFIDDEIIGRAVTWLLRHHKSSGEFTEPGRIIDNIQGGSGQGASLTAYILDALLDVKGVSEIYVPNIDDAITKATTFLENNIDSYRDSYSQAIIAHSLAKAGSNITDVLIQKLEKTAMKKDNTIHWETTHSSYHGWRPYHQRASAIDIETAGYVLKTHAVRNDFSSGLPVLKWLTAVRNPNGGFTSTQDTVVAIDSLAAFASIMTSGAYKVSADVSSGSFSKHFDLDETSATNLQAADVPQFTGNFDIHATGHGIGHVEFAVFFNVEKPVEEQFFEISHDVELESINMFTLRTCVKYIKEKSNNMAVVEVTIPSGFEPDMDSVGKITNLQNTEEFGRQLVFYFSQLEDTNTCMRFTARRNGLVAKIKASPIRVYDYYEPTHQAVSFYQPTVLQTSSVCDVCPDCCTKAKN